MINLPRWLIFLVAFWVIVFGAFRIYIAKQKLKDETSPKPPVRKGGLYAQSRRRHILFGFAYLALGGVLIAMGLGVEIPTLANCSGDKANKAEKIENRELKKPSDSTKAIRPSSIQATPVDE